MLVTRVGASRGGGRGLALRPIGVRDEMKEFNERWNAFRLATRREHVMSQIVMVVVPLLYCPRKTLTERRAVSMVFVWQPPRAFFVLLYKFKDLFHHDKWSNVQATTEDRGRTVTDCWRLWEVPGTVSVS